MGNHRQDGRSELFLVRVWAVDVGNANGEVAWRGKVQRVTNGEVQGWVGWPELMDRLLAMLSKQAGREQR